METETLKLRNATIIDTQIGSLRPDAELFIRNGKIEPIRTGSAPVSPDGVRTLDVSGK